MQKNGEELGTDELTDELSPTESAPDELKKGRKKTKKKKKKKKKKRKKSKKKAKQEPVQTFVPSKVDNDSPESSDTEQRITELDNLKKQAQSSKPMHLRRRLYRPHIGLPGQSYLRAEIEDPITLVEEDAWSEGFFNFGDRRRTLYNFEKEGKKALEKQTQQEQMEKELNENLVESSFSPEKFRELQELLQTKSSDVDTECIDLQSGISQSTSTCQQEMQLQHCPLAATRNSCRFQIPMDVRILQTMQPWEYLRSYCEPSGYADNLFTRIFQKNKNRMDKLPFEKLLFVITEALGQELSTDQKQKLTELSGIDPSTPIDCRLFIGLCCLAMRILCHDMEEWIQRNSEKEILEIMDFNSLLLHWNKVTVNSKTRQLLEFINSA